MYKYVENLPMFIEAYGGYKGLSDQEVISLFNQYGIFEVLLEDMEYFSILTNSKIKDIIDLNIQNKNPNFYLEDIVEFDMIF